MDQPLDMWRALDAAFLSFDRVAAQLTSWSSAVEVLPLRGNLADVTAPVELTGAGRWDRVNGDAAVAATTTGGQSCDRYCGSSAEKCASSSSSSSGAGSGDEDPLQLSLSSQSSLGYRSSSDASDDAPTATGCSDSGTGRSSRSSTASSAVAGSSPSPRELPALGGRPEGVDACHCLLSSPCRKTCRTGTRCPGAKRLSTADSSSAGIEAHSHSFRADDHVQASSVRPTPSRQSLIPRASSATNTVTEEDFERVFRTTRKVEILSSADLETRLLAIEDVLTDSSKLWEQRIEALKGLRQLVLAAGSESAEVGAHLRGLAVGFQLALAEARPQVTREACFTVGFLAWQLGTALEPFAEIVFHPLINLVLSSTSLIAKAGGIVLLFLFRHVRSQKMLTLVIQHMTSKAVQIRRQASDLMELAVLGWPISSVDKCHDRVREACLKNCEDADAYVREVCIRVLGKLSATNSSQAVNVAVSSNKPELVRKSLAGKHLNSRLADFPSSLPDRGPLHGVHSPLGSAATNSESPAPAAGSSHDLREKEMVQRSPVKASIVPGAPCAGPLPSAGHRASPIRGLLKAADLAGGRHRASALQSHSVVGRAWTTAVAPTSSPKCRLGNNGSSSSENSNSGSTTDVPAQRAQAYESAAARLNQLPSPGRLLGSGMARERHHSARSLDSNDQISASATPASLPSESAKDSGAGTADEDNDDIDDDDFEAAASDLSSVCSETLEIDGHRGVGGSRVSSGSVAALLPANADIGEVLANVGSPLWAARRRGLLQLQRFVSEQRSLSVGELKRVAELFTRTFHDPDAKVYSTFLDTLVEVVSVHPHDLSGWLPTLLSKLLLLNHHGGMRLTSITSKVQRTLRAIRASFDNTVQFRAVCAILSNEGSTMGVQEKLRTLQFLLALVRQMDPSEFNSRHDTDMLTRAFEQLVIAAGEVKSAGVRKMAPEVLVGLFELNAPEFSYVLSRSPGPVQAAVRSSLQTYMQSALTGTAASDSSRSPPRSEQSSRVVAGETALKDAGAAGRTFDGIGSCNGSSAASALRLSGSPFAERKTASNYSNGWRSARSQPCSSEEPRDGDRAAACSSSDSGIQGSPTDIGGLLSPTVCPPLLGVTVAANDEHSLQTPGLPVRDSDFSSERGAKQSFDLTDGTSRPSFANTLHRALPDVVTHMAGSSDRKGALNEIGSSAESSKEASILPCSRSSSESDCERDGAVTRADSVLSMVQGSSNLDYRELCALVVYVKAGGLGVLEDFVEPLVLKALQASHCASLEGTAAAEELLDVVMSAANPEQLLAILCKASQSDDSQLCLAAIRTESKIIQQLTDDVALRHVDALLLGLVQGFNHSESALRKASVLALVELYAHVGDTLIRDHLTKSLNSGQMKLLNVYIERSSVKAK